MKIDQTKCDHCGKVHDNDSFLLCGGIARLLLETRTATGRGSFDFCNEDCLRRFLNGRYSESHSHEESFEGWRLAMDIITAPILPKDAKERLDKILNK